MMLLKSIELQGFKSFPDKTLLTFNEGITAVIGPNGSGKSNISDAVRWVLGEQSSKSLRGSKMEDVIFGGTAARRPLGFAEVSLTIDNRERGLPFDHDEVTVTRRYFRSGESEYLLNRTAVRLKDIHELFMDTGLGRDGYSMIGQGRIDEIVGSKSEERRDIFEEAAGISRYRYRKAEAERRLRQADDNLLRLQDITQELESRVGPLKEQSERAEEFLQYAGEKRELEIGLWLRTLDDSKERLREQENALTLAQYQYRQVEQELETLIQQSEDSAQTALELTARTDELRRKAAAAEEAGMRIEGEIAVLQTTIYHQNETIKRLQEEMERLGQDDQSVAQEILHRESLKETLRASMEEKEKEAYELQEQLLALSQESESHAGELQQTSSVLSAILAQMADCRVESVAAESTAQELTARRETLAQQQKEMQLQLESAEKERKQTERFWNDIEEKAAACSNALQGYEIRLKTREEKCNKAKEALDRMTLDIGEKERRIRILKDLEQNMEGYHYSTKTVIQKGRAGSLSGIRGSVLQLLSVDRQYATAVETALGAAAQYVVVNTEQDAKRAISFLKNAGAGRVTFLPISVIKGTCLQEKNLDDCAGFIGLACELVQYDNEYEAVVRSLLGKIVVAEDMDSAVAIARRFGYKFRVVTLDGQVVNAGGSLTGGSLAKNAGMLNRGGDILRLQEQLKKLQAQYEESRGSFAKLQEELGAAQADTLSASAELASLNEDKIRVMGERKRLTEQVERLSGDAQQMDEEASLLTRRLEESGVRRAQSEQRLQALQEEYGQKQGELEQLSETGDALGTRREALSAKVSACKLEALALQKDLDIHTAALADLNRQKEQRGVRAQELAQEMEQIRAGIAAKESSIEALQQSIAEQKQNALSYEATAKELGEQRLTLEQNAGAMREKEREQTAQREKLGGELARLEERKSTLLKEHDDIIAKLYDEYGLTRTEAAATGIEIEDSKQATRRLQELKSKIKALGNVNVAAIEEYKEVSARYEYMTGQINDVVTSKNELNRLIRELTGQMKEMFLDQFTKINEHFGEMFRILFGGGGAELKLSDPENPLESGIEIIAQPPGKNISIIEQLSGGEKALIAVAIYFSIMKVNAPPFCILDEVEAALDDVNVDRFAEQVRKMSDRTQFIIITHRRGTMEEADVLYGVTMQEKGVSKLLTLNVSELARTLDLESKSGK